MNASTHPRLLTTGFVAVVLACLYLASATAAEARVDGIKIRQNMASSTVASSTRPQVDLSCMSEAVETRETALATAWDGLDEDVKAALAKRKTALIAAWDIDNNADRGKAIRAAWTAWKTDKKAAHTAFRADRKSAWDAFKKTAKEECKMTLPKEEGLEKSSSDSVSI